MAAVPSEANQHGLGINRISVTGFKSLAMKTDLEIRPLTVLAGANSSGKSSFMQPLLLMKQTLESDVNPAGPFLLSGSYTRYTEARQFLSRAVKPNASVQPLTLEFGFNGGLTAGMAYSANPETGLIVEETWGSNGVKKSKWRIAKTSTPEELKALADVVVKHPNLVVFSDEIYEKLVYDGLKFVSFAALHPQLLEQTLTFNCHSKSFAMTGWRIGYIGGPKPVIDAINKLQSQMTSHITSFTQSAAALALTDPRGAESVESMRREFEQRGQHMWQRLSALPKVHCVRPQGAFYCFPNISAYFGKPGITDAVSFAATLLEKSHVAVVPGNDCGFDTHVRLSFATSLPQIDKGIDRIAEFLKKL